MATIERRNPNLNPNLNPKPYNPQDWLQLSGDKLSRYYAKTQGVNTFKMSKKIKGPATRTREKEGMGSECAPMIHPEEIKISVFEYPDPKDGEYKRGPVKTVQHINPFLTATNMLDALKLVVGGDPEIAAHEAAIESIKSEIARLEQKATQLEKDIQSLENELKEEIVKSGVEGVEVSNPKIGKSGVSYNIKGGAKTNKISSLREQINSKKTELESVKMALADANKKLETTMAMAPKK